MATAEHMVIAATTIDSHDAFDVLKSKLREAGALLEPIDWSGYRDPKTALALLPQCLDHILGLPEGQKRYGDAVLAITKAFALCSTLEEAMGLSEEVAFLQGLRALLLKGEQKQATGSPRRNNTSAKEAMGNAILTEMARGLAQKLRQTEVISEEWAREELGDQIQAAVAAALSTQV